jgi:hypothetical protein
MFLLKPFWKWKQIQLAGGTEVELIDDGSLGAIAGGVEELGCPAVVVVDC